MTRIAKRKRSRPQPRPNLRKGRKSKCVLIDSQILYHYVIIRKDLPPGVALAQTIHAAGASSPGNLPPSTHAVALSVKSEEELLKLESTLQRAGIPHFPIREPDAPWNGSLMAIGIVPMVRKQLRKYLSRYPLYQ